MKLSLAAAAVFRFPFSIFNFPLLAGWTGETVPEFSIVSKIKISLRDDSAPNPTKHGAVHVISYATSILP
jgi:hypothetical protein